MGSLIEYISFRDNTLLFSIASTKRRFFLNLQINKRLSINE